MNSYSVALLIVVWIPLLVVWVVVMADVIRRRDLGTSTKVLWAVVCTLLWPTMIAYLMLRPPRGRLEDPEDRTDPHARLVDAVLLHEAGRIDNVEMASIASALHRRESPGGSTSSG